jgi:dipeptidyl-peptidase 4
MRVKRLSECVAAFFGAWIGGGAVVTFGQASVPSPKNTETRQHGFSVERIFGTSSLLGHLTTGIVWAPDGKHVSYFTDMTGGDAKQGRRKELWEMDAATGEKQLLVGADKLDTALPAEAENTSQATGLGRHAPGQYQWAPNGEALLLQGGTALAWFDLKSQTAKPLVSGKAPIADPKISPDGKWVSFVRDHNLWLVRVSDAKERAFTKGGSEEIRKGELDWVYPEELELTTAYWWAPDSSSIAFLEMDERKVTTYPLVDFASPVGEADEERYPVAGGNNPIVRVFVGKVDGGEPRAMDTGADPNIYIPRVMWLPDSKQVAIERLNRAQTVIDLLFAEPGSGKSRVVLSEKDLYWINVSDDLTFLKDGKRFLWTSEKTGYRHIYLYDLGGKPLAQLTNGEWEISAIQSVDEAKGIVYFTATEKSPLERHLYRVGLDGAGFSRITKEEGTHAIKFAPGAGAYVDTYSTNLVPPRQDLMHVDGSRAGVINENKVAALEELHLPPVEFLHVKSHDDIELNAMMIKPPNFDSAKKYPVIVYTYGGPHLQVVTKAWGGPNALWHELMARNGYIIFALDNRGSAGRGHLFEEPIHFRFGAQELSDQRDGAAYLKSLPYVDGNRIGIWGWSYGGHMTLHAMFEDPQDFKVGFAGGPVTDWHYYDSIYTERYIGLLPQNEESYQESSPIETAKNFQGKLMIAHGTGDDNVHYANTLTLINELIENEKYVEVIALPGRGHGANDPEARVVLWNRVTKYFLDNL